MMNAKEFKQAVRVHYANRRANELARDARVRQAVESAMEDAIANEETKFWVSDMTDTVLDELRNMGFEARYLPASDTGWDWLISLEDEDDDK